MITEWGDYYEVDAGFDIFDLFGKARLKDAADKYDDLRFTKNKQINDQKRTIERQGKMLTDAYSKIEELEKTIESKDQIINDISEDLRNERSKNLFAESAKVSCVKAAENLSMQNTNLKYALNKSRLDYDELSKTHERLLDVIKKERPDISLDELERKVS